MVKTTKAQRQAIKRVFDRGPIMIDTCPNISGIAAYQKQSTYREFRKTVRGGFDCLMVEWAGMWLGIETDGHTHS